MDTKYNKTQLNPDTTMERHVYHRDQFAHYLRWTHVLKEAKIGMNILDFGCGSGNLLEVFYRNRFKPKSYVGLDIRKQTIDMLNQKWNDLPFADFQVADLCSKPFPNLIHLGNEWDIIACFEVIEHIGKHNVEQFLNNIVWFMNDKTVLLISTPCYDARVGAADNHIIDGKICELSYDEMKNALESSGLEIVNQWGTFASQKDYKKSEEFKKIPEELWTKLHEYFDSNILSNLMAPLFPKYSRNVMWKCQKRAPRSSESQ